MKKIYLAGSVPKGDYEETEFEDWRVHYTNVLKKHMNCICIDPRKEERDEEDLLGKFGMDCKLIKNADIIIVNAEKQLGVGTSQEMLIAKYFSKLLICILPRNSFHRKSDLLFHKKIIKDWIHPFIYATADVIIESIEDIASVDMEHISPKNISIISDAITHWENKPKE